MKHIYVFTGYLLISFTLAAQPTVTINADKDNSIYAESGTLSNGKSEYLFAGRTGTQAANSVRRTLVHFNLQAIPANAVITNVTLSMYCNNVARLGGDYGVALFKLLNDWGEGNSAVGVSGGMGAPAATTDATWTARFYNTQLWTVPGGDFVNATSGSVAIAGAGPVQISTAQMIADVQGWLSQPATNFGWVLNGADESISNSARRFASREAATLSQRPQLTITYTTALPITLQSFKLTLQQQNVLLNWSTSAEVNNDYFVIENSADGNNFKAIARVKGSGTTNLTQAYTYLHLNPPAGNNYYRLAQTDVNGEVKYSAIKMMSKQATTSIKIVPNPASNFFSLQSNMQLVGKMFNIYSSKGNLVMTGIITSRPINIKALNSGTYYLSMRVENETQTYQLFKR